MSLDAAHSFLDAAQRGDNEAMRHAMSALAPILAPPLRRTLQRHHSLVQRCRLESEDVVQRVFERMLASPPNNPRAQDPLAVLTAWARAVAINYLLDLARRVGREAPLGLDSDGDPLEDAATLTPSAPQERQHQAAEQWRLARRCADTELARHKHLRELFYAIADEPELGARELAQRIGLLSDSARPPIDEAAARRAEQYVWKLRERVQRKLADYFEALERGPAQGAR